MTSDSSLGEMRDFRVVHDELVIEGVHEAAKTGSADNTDCGLNVTDTNLKKLSSILQVLLLFFESSLHIDLDIFKSFSFYTNPRKPSGPSLQASGHTRIASLEQETLSTVFQSVLASLRKGCCTSPLV
mmetsp:Transcript_4132/g.8951  ORF Transcript_4132/g.8951 Transcript_4132/m.8951 type:complete len:128 (-) Transcript_4132:70-453(-)